MSYENLITENKKEANYENLQKDLNKVESFINKCLQMICECSSSVAEREFNVTSI
jgi:hypothetical protein